MSWSPKMYRVANTSHQVPRVAETRGLGLSLWDYGFQALSSHKAQKTVIPGCCRPPDAGFVREATVFQV